ncbi:MAG: PIN domain-containing protein [Halobacteriota archaeon]
MKLVCDTNVVFSALIAGGKTRELIISNETHLYVPEYFFLELDDHRSEIARKSQIPEERIELLYTVLFKDIEVVPREEFEDRLPEASDAIGDTDPDDVPFLALALHLDAGVWTDDTDFEQQDEVDVWKTHDLVERFEL